VHLSATAPDPGNFSNGDWPQGPPPSPWPDVPPAVLFRRVLVEGREEFELLRPIRYRDVAGDRTITVPSRDVPFTTDLTSVPSWFTWLVPKSGAHLPAALIHDGLVSDGPPTYEVDPPQVVDRIDADRIFRDAMRDTRVGTVRRWLVWSAVATTSLVLGARASWSARQRWYYRAVVALTLGAILYLGTAATADLLDRRVGWLWDLPWMHGSTAAEVVGGLAGAVVVPLVLAVLWGRHYAAGAVAGIALATLVHVTAAVALVALGYQVAERVARTRMAVPLAVTLLVAAAVAFGWALA
jgi:hypothetical protein